jgi:hypothetical protein
LPAAFGDPTASAAADGYLKAPGAAGLFAAAATSGPLSSGGAAAWARGLRGGFPAFKPAASSSVEPLTLTPPLLFAAAPREPDERPRAREKRVISFGLYGAHPKYVGCAP